MLRYEQDRLAESAVRGAIAGQDFQFPGIEPDEVAAVAGVDDGIPAAAVGWVSIVLRQRGQLRRRCNSFGSNDRGTIG